jgi:protease I
LSGPRNGGSSEFRRIARLVTHGLGESEFLELRQALVGALAEPVVICRRSGQMYDMRHLDKASLVAVARTCNEARARDLDGVMLPGGALNADRRGIELRALEFVRETDRAGKPIAVLRTAPWLLVSAGPAGTRLLASSPTLPDGIR